MMKIPEGDYIAGRYSRRGRSNMLYDIKADSLVTDDIITITVEANSIYEAEMIGWKRLPDYADHGSMWIVPNEWQPYGAGHCFKVEVYANSKYFGKERCGTEYFDTYDDALEFAKSFDIVHMYASCITDSRLIWLDIDIEDCDGECDTCKHKRTVPGTDERIDREPAYYCDKETR